MQTRWMGGFALKEAIVSLQRNKDSVYRHKIGWTYATEEDVFSFIYIIRVILQSIVDMSES